MLSRTVFRTATRGFAAAAKRAQPPTRIYSPAGTYAHSLLDACIEEKADPKVVSSQLTGWVDTMEENPILKQFLDDTEFGWQEKEAKLQEHVYKEAGIGDGLGDADKVVPGTLTREIISVAIEEGQVALLPEIAADFEKLVLAHVKEVKCHVTSAAELTAAQTKKIQAKLNTLINKGETLTVSYSVDEDLLGGLTLQIGSQFQDLSARSAIINGEAALRSM